MESPKMPTVDDAIEAASQAARAIYADVYVYNGPIARGLDLPCIEEISKNIHHTKVILLLVTGGGDPDAAYKITRYLQSRYDHFTALILEFCKSAGTLIALGAHELACMPFGELGPLDIQLGKVDKFDAPQSGLAIQEALDTLEGRARKSFDNIVSEYMEHNGGLLSFSSASQAASAFVTNLYAPILARIDPEEVGARSRSMRIAHEYGKRLAIGSQNLKPDTLMTLAEKYPSHSFVRDRREATTMFKNVRDASEAERQLVAALGRFARFPRQSARDLLFGPLSANPNPPKEARRDEADPGARAQRDGSDRAANAGKAKPVARKPGRSASDLWGEGAQTAKPAHQRDLQPDESR